MVTSSELATVFKCCHQLLTYILQLIGDATPDLTQHPDIKLDYAPPQKGAKRVKIQNVSVESELEQESNEEQEQESSQPDLPTAYNTSYTFHPPPQAHATNYRSFSNSSTSSTLSQVSQNLWPTYQDEQQVVYYQPTVNNMPAFNGETYGLPITFGAEQPFVFDPQLFTQSPTPLAGTKRSASQVEGWDMSMPSVANKHIRVG